MQTMNTIAAMTAVKNILRAAAPRGTQPHSKDRLSEKKHADYFSLEAQRGWGVGCTINVSLRYDSLEEFAVVQRNGKNELAPKRKSNHSVVIKVPTYRLQVEVSWSCTGRSVAQAQAAVALYQECINIAAEIESSIAGTATLYNQIDIDAAVAAAAAA